MKIYVMEHHKQLISFVLSELKKVLVQYIYPVKALNHIF